MRTLIIIAAFIGLVGCGKSVDQLVKTGQDVIGIVGQVYQDVKENVDTAKKVLIDPADPSKAPVKP